MYVRSLHIDGFGIFHDASVDELPPGLAVMVGSNESGKSTLKEFFRYVLFGPPAGPNRNTYPPLRGGRHGGRLVGVLQDGRQLTIQRSDQLVTVHEAEGVVRKVEPVRHLLGGIERGTFERVFAVSLKDLQGTQIIDDRDIGNRLDAAGTGFGARTLPAILDQLDHEIDTLLKPRGRHQEVARLKSQLADVAQQIAGLGPQASDYARSRQQRRDLECRVEERRRRTEQIGGQLARIEQLSGAHQHWARLAKHRQDAAQLASARDFPASGLQRFESLRREIEDLLALANGRREKLAHIEGRCAAISIDSPLLAARVQIEHLLGERSALESALNDLPVVTAACERSRGAFEQRLRDLGADWTPDRLAAVDSSVAVRQEVGRVAEQIRDVRTALTTAQVQVENLQADWERAEQEAHAARHRAQSIPAWPEERRAVFDAQQRTLGRLRSLLHGRDVRTTRLEARRAAWEETRSQLSAVERQLAAPAAILPLWLPVAVAVSGTVPAVAAAVTDAYPSAAAFVAAAVAFAGLLLVLRHRQQSAEAIRRDHVEAEHRRLSAKSQTLDDETADLQRQIEEVSAELAEAAGAVRLAVPRQWADVEEISQQLDTQRRQQAAWLAAQQDVETAERQAHTRAESLSDARPRQQELEQRSATLQQSWRAWLADRGLDTTVAADQFTLLLDGVEQARQALDRYREGQRRVAQVESRLKRIRLQLDEVLRQCGRRSDGEPPGVAEIDELGSSLAHTVEQHRQRERLVVMKQEFESEFGRLDRQLARKHERCDELLRSAGAEDENAFRQAAEAFRQWQQAKLAGDEEQLALRTIAGSQRAWRAMESELRNTTPLELADRRDQLATERDVLQAQIAADEQAIGGLDEQLRRMARDERLGQLRLEQEVLRQRLSDALRRWATRVVCRKLLAEARDVNERDRQPQVVRQASQYLDTMTGGRYRLVRSLTEPGVQLENGLLGRRAEPVWSSGLADQAYLALRLGLAREFARHTEPLPVILDDVLVRFDPSRRTDAARVLLDFAAAHQVFLFSCRADLAALVTRVHQDHHPANVPLAFYDIQDGTIRRRSSKPEA